MSLLGEAYHRACHAGPSLEDEVRGAGHPVTRQLLEYHPIVGHRFIPGLRARVPHEGGGYLIQVNGAGFRCNREFEPSRPPGVRRILLFGDSYTAGDGVLNEQRYGDLLERTLPRGEVYNFGLPGTGTDQQFLAHREFASGIEHDLLVIAVLVENIRRVAARYRLWTDGGGKVLCFAKPYFELSGGKLVLRQAPPPREPVEESALPPEARAAIDRGGRFAPLRNLLIGLGVSDLAQKLSRYQPVPEYDNPGDPAWCLLRAILEAWISERRAPVLLVPLPLYAHVEGDADPASYQARFRELAASARCALHDPLPDLMRPSPEERRGFRFARDPHPTPRGHAALAASLTPAVEALLARSEEAGGG